MAMVVIGSTAYEFYLENHNEKIRPSQRILTSFSLITNGRKFLSTHCENENLTCLYGLKVLSMCAVVGGHIGVMRAAISAKNPILFFSKEVIYFFNQLSQFSVICFSGENNGITVFCLVLFLPLKPISVWEGSLSVTYS